MATKFLGIDHIGVAVSDLNQATKTYQDLLGFSLGGHEELPARGLQVRFVDVGESRIELISPMRPDSEISGYLTKKGEGLHHICVRVENIEAALTEMKQRGAKLIDETPKVGAHGSRVAFVHPKGSHGVLLELVEKSGTGVHHG